jgi:ABC-2 type transport system ATP-binding protein
MNETIRLEDLTKDYGLKRGVFGENLVIHQGEMLGFVGTNGSGKTTTIRLLMGFIKPTGGHAYVNGLESWENAPTIAKSIGYVPGEIAFPDLKTGTEFLKSQAEFLHVGSLDYANELVERLQLDPRANLKRMSKGMKQKTALVAALMGNPPILLLDEPTTGLDPLMRRSFLGIVREEHAKGKTILMSSHMFEEVEDTCDRVALISDGRLIDCVDMASIRNREVQDFKIEFKNKDDYLRFQNAGFPITRKQDEFNQVTISLNKNEISRLFQALATCDVRFISEVAYTLKKHFDEVLKEQNHVQ